jgi:hypothetical protein
MGTVLRVGDVYHVTLDPSLAETQRRVEARGGDRTPEWVSAHVTWMRARYGPWTCRIDNTLLDPEAAIAEIARRTSRGEGRLDGPVPASNARSSFGAGDVETPHLGGESRRTPN